MMLYTPSSIHPDIRIWSKDRNIESVILLRHPRATIDTWSKGFCSFNRSNNDAFRICTGGSLFYSLPWRASPTHIHTDSLKHTKRSKSQCRIMKNSDALLLKQFPLCLGDILFGWYCTLHGIVIPYDPRWRNNSSRISWLIDIKKFLRNVAT